MNDKSQVEYMLNDLRAMVNNVIVKLSHKAEQYETADIKREADRFIAASLEKDTFNSYRAYPMDVLAKAGISNLNELIEYSSNRQTIPAKKRKAVLKAMRQTVIDEYVEQNDYYRELIGMPPLNAPEEEWIYLTEAEMKHYEIDEVRPIHDYPREIQIKLERGLIPQLIKLYPERTYLQHMGSKAVNLVRARQAKNFEIIFTDINLDVVFMRAFFETYDFAREYFMNIIYNKAFKERYGLYDNYIGMHIMIMTIQRLIVDTIKMGIDRDFYDLISVQKLFNVYGVPFFDDLPLDYQRTIVKNVNMLIRTKSTDKVLYDIANTLFYERVRIYKYYLVRERKFDENGEPVFEYKEEILDDPPEKFYLKSSNKKTYELAVRGDRFKTIEVPVDYAPESIYTKDRVTGEVYRLYMDDDRMKAELAKSKDQICEEILMFNEVNDKYILLIDKDRLTTEYTPYATRTVYDYEKMFDVYFQATDIMERNVISTLETKYNRYHYKEVVEDDVYWWETEELKKELYERDYNFIDTKYISVTVMQNLTKMLYETAYFLNLIVDHKNTDNPIEQRILNADNMKFGTDYLYLDLDRFTNTPVSIFDAVMMLCALVSKKNGMKGNIIVKSPSQILSVLGFNFELNFDLIRENIKKYKRVFKNQEILKYLDLLDIRTVEDIDTLYNNFKNFAEFCAHMVYTTTDINEYKAYKELYKVFTVREDTTELFKMSNGEVANTYLEYLYDKLPVIADMIDNMHKDKTGIYIEHILGKLNELIPEIEYLNTMNGTNNNIVQAIIGLIQFFKSYTIDMRTLNIMYMFDNRMLNKIYMIDDPRLFIKLYPREALPTYHDMLKPTVTFDKYDNLIIYTPAVIFNKILNKDYVGEYDEIEQILNEFTVLDNIQLDYKDTMELINKLIANDVVDLRDFNNYESCIHHKEKFETQHIITLTTLLAILDKLELDYKDIIGELRSSFISIDEMKIRLKDELLIRIYSTEKYQMEHKMTFSTGREVFDTLMMDYKDLIRKIYYRIYLGSNVVTRETNLVYDQYTPGERFDLEHEHWTTIGLEKEDTLELMYKDLIHNVDNDIHVSNTGIVINETIKVTYED